MKKILALAGLALPVCSFAAPAGHVDIFYALKADVGAGGASIDGNGFGLKAAVPLGDGPALLIEHDSNSYDTDFGIDFDVKHTRAGLGLLGRSGSGVVVEYAKLDLEVDGDGGDADGFGLHARLSGNPSPTINLYGQVGYLKLDADGETVDGPEFLLGVATKFEGNLGGFAEFRSTKLEDESDDELKFEDLRIGLRIGFK